jgi:hypothetical protein
VQDKTPQGPGRAATPEPLAKGGEEAETPPRRRSRASSVSSLEDEPDWPPCRVQLVQRSADSVTVRWDQDGEAGEKLARLRKGEKVKYEVQYRPAPGLADRAVREAWTPLRPPVRILLTDR